ncbi:MAG TPA: heparan-alpha-glucosaminide N-acetyltransferase domain-containing protein [Pyrinomonadaceae bacterium]
MIATTSVARPSAVATRISALDTVRGLVMVLMALDHVRVYSGVPAGGLSPGIFFTRWVTHFCAPAFVFFAGTSAFLYGRKIEDKRALARYLVTRGLILVALELTVIRFSWTFNFDYAHFVLAGVIWMLGWCMVLLAGLIWLPTRVVGLLGLATIFFQQVFSFVPRIMPATIRDSVGWLWEFVYSSGIATPPPFNILYVLVPWIGVMAAGYAFGTIMVREPAERRRFCLYIGLTATALFLVLGTLAVVLQPAPANAPPALFRLLNQQKYPASQLFLLMTLGPVIALLPLAERMRGWFVELLTTFGRVPLFYYLLHIPVIHIVALIVWYLRTGSVHADFFAAAPRVSVPPELRWGLPLLYLVFVIVIALLYFPCRWFASVKARRKHDWLRYL